MSKKYRTPQKDRTTYVCRDAYGKTWMELRPGENGVTEADIAALHRADDDEINSDAKQHRKGRKVAPNGTVSFEQVDEDGIWIGDGNLNPLDIIIADENKQKVRAAIAKLPRKQSEAINAVWINGMSARNYAMNAGIKENTVSDRIKRGFENLRTLLGE